MVGKVTEDLVPLRDGAEGEGVSQAEAAQGWKTLTNMVGVG